MKTQRTVIAYLMALLLSALVGCSSSKTGGLKEGGIYSFKNDNGTYSVLKILKVEGGGVHVKIYSNQFDSPPDKVDESKLYMAGVNHKDTETTSVADAPMKGETFANYHATFVQQGTVTPQELEGYNQWKKSGGEYF